MDRPLPLETARKAARAALDALGGGTLGRKLDASPVVALHAELAHPYQPVTLRCAPSTQLRIQSLLVTRARELPELFLTPVTDVVGTPHGCVTVWPQAVTPAPDDPTAWARLTTLAARLHAAPRWSNAGLDLTVGVAERLERLTALASTARQARAVKLATAAWPRWPAAHFDATEAEPHTPTHGDLQPSQLVTGVVGAETVITPDSPRLWALERAGMNPAIGDLARLYVHHALGTVDDATARTALEAYRDAAPAAVIAGDSLEALWARTVPFGRLQLLRSALRVALTAADFDEYDQLDILLDAVERQLGQTA